MEQVLYNDFGNFGMGIFFMIMAVILLIGVCSIVCKRRSGLYREDLVNMYVAATIRQLAEKDNIDLNKEYETFKQWCKKRKLEDKGLDYAIEEDLKDKVNKEMSEEEKKVNIL